MGKGDPDREEREASLKIIESLTLACEQLASGKKKPEELEEIITDAKVLVRGWTIKEPDGRRRLLFDGTARPGTNLLGALVVTLRRDHELVERIHRWFPDELKQLDDASRFAQYDDLVDALRLMKWNRRLKKYQPLTSEQRRNEVPRRGYGLIGEQFGSSASLGGLRRVEATCFDDDIFKGGSVNMMRLVELFGEERHELLKLAVKKEREKGRYTYLSILAIMKKLWRQRPIPPRQKRKRSKPGAPHRAPWLNDQDLRERVLCGIQERLNSLSVSQDVKDAFEKVVRTLRRPIG